MAVSCWTSCLVLPTGPPRPRGERSLLTGISQFSRVRRDTVRYLSVVLQLLRSLTRLLLVTLCDYWRSLTSLCFSATHSPQSCPSTFLITSKFCHQPHTGCWMQLLKTISVIRDMTGINLQITILIIAIKNTLPNVTGIFIQLLTSTQLKLQQQLNNKNMFCAKNSSDCAINVNTLKCFSFISRNCVLSLKILKLKIFREIKETRTPSQFKPIDLKALKLIFLY